jgi:predicted RNase H-like HicB family nuclease/uncharacterized protein (DUF1778 family)
MEKRTYIGIIHKDDGSDFGVSFLDFPGCASAGKDLTEAGKNAVEALQGHIDVMVEGGDFISDPSSLSECKSSDETAVAFIAVEVTVPDAAVKRINITARASDLAVIDAYLRKSGRNRDRSDFLIRSALDRAKREGAERNALPLRERSDEYVEVAEAPPSARTRGRSRSDARVRDVRKKSPSIFERFTTQPDNKRHEKKPA